MALWLGQKGLIAGAAVRVMGLNPAAGNLVHGIYTLSSHITDNLKACGSHPYDLYSVGGVVKQQNNLNYSIKPISFK